MSGREDERLARVALASLVEPGNRELGTLVAAAGAPVALARLIAGAVPDQLAAAAAPRLAAGDPYRAAEVTLSRTERLGARLLIPTDDEWPAQVADLATVSRADTGDRIDRDTYPPLCLWVRGGGDLGEAVERSVAIVGARAATEYGKHVASEIAYGLAGRGWTVVSGGAYGIDAAAHRGALAASGTTVAVLACGVDRPYPAGNASLFERIADDGLLISEWPPGAAPHRHRFLIRNRVIAASTRGTVMVEAAARSGARQTLGRAVLLGRAAMVVPGPVTSAMSVGCHSAIRHFGARLVTSHLEVLEEVGRIGDDLAPLPRAQERPDDLLDPLARQVLDVVPPRRAADIDHLAAAAGVSVRDAMRALGLLDAGGFVIKTPEGYRLPPPDRTTAPVAT
ncbi:MAG TPA: DNA-processing protein DprA [Micromonosporaceae bacterium]